MKKRLIALGAFLVLALGALPSMASCPCQSQSSFQYQANSVIGNDSKDIILIGSLMNTFYDNSGLI